MKLAFVLPGLPKPVGGFKFIYRLAEDLSKRYEVNVYHQNINKGFIAFCKYIILLRLNKFKLYPLDTFNLKVRYLNNVADLKHYSAIYICSWQLMRRNFIAIQESPRKFKHIVMDLPGYMGPVDEILYVWRNLKIEYFAISNYLMEYFSKNVGGNVKYIGCLVPKVFPVNQSIKKDIDVLMNYSTGLYKNSERVVSLALELTELGLTVGLYGREHCSDIELAGVKYFVNLNDKEVSVLYQRAKVFVSISHFEGFGIPALEAIYYGAYLVTSDYLGNRDYLDENVMCILSGEEDLGPFIKEKVLLSENYNENQYIKSMDFVSRWLNFSEAQYNVLLGI